MASKKNAINISILLVLISIVIMLIIGNLEQANYWNETVFAVMSGVCGSSLATLWIFIFEYRIEKQRLLQEIFSLGIEIKDRLPWFHDLKENDKVFSYLQGKQYTQALYHQNYESLSPEEKAYYEVCKFTDLMLNVSSKRVERFWADICELDFWTDNCFTKCFRKKTYSEMICATFSPVYTSLTTATTLNNGYNFQVLFDFRHHGFYDADSIYGLRKDMISYMHTALQATGSTVPSLSAYFYEKLWIFRAAFCKNENREDQRQALSAFMKGTEYRKIR